jgi:hypothetical protein
MSQVFTLKFSNETEKKFVQEFLNSRMFCAIHINYKITFYQPSDTWAKVNLLLNKSIVKKVAFPFSLKRFFIRGLFTLRFLLSNYLIRLILGVNGLKDIFRFLHVFSCLLFVLL